MVPYFSDSFWDLVLDCNRATVIPRTFSSWTSNEHLRIDFDAPRFWWQKGYASLESLGRLSETSKSVSSFILWYSGQVEEKTVTRPFKQDRIQGLKTTWWAPAWELDKKLLNRVIVRKNHAMKLLCEMCNWKVAASCNSHRLHLSLHIKTIYLLASLPNKKRQDRCPLNTSTVKWINRSRIISKRMNPAISRQECKETNVFVITPRKV